MQAKRNIGNLSLFAVTLGYLVLNLVFPLFMHSGVSLKQNLLYGGLIAFFEAGMVGGLADWFAVTALFRHPLGIPVPHTNLLVQNRRSLEASLSQVVCEFLSPDIILGYLDDQQISGQLQGLLKDKKVISQLQNGIHQSVHGALSTLTAKADPIFQIMLKSAEEVGMLEKTVHMAVTSIQGAVTDALADTQTDTAIKEQLKGLVLMAFEHGLHRELAEEVRKNIANWSDQELVSFVEDRVGNDLQIIRLNGALVGGLFGMLIYYATHLLTMHPW